MSTATRADSIPELVDGDRLSSAEFERRYRDSPHIRKAELIEGVVHVASPVSDDHGPPHARLTQWFGFYELGTPHLTCSIEGTVRLDEANQPQPDIHLRIASGLGGQSTRTADRYVEGAPGTDRRDRRELQGDRSEGAAGSLSPQWRSRIYHLAGPGCRDRLVHPPGRAVRPDLAFRGWSPPERGLPRLVARPRGADPGRPPRGLPRRPARLGHARARGVRRPPPKGGTSVTIRGDRP